MAMKSTKVLSHFKDVQCIRCQLRHMSQNYTPQNFRMKQRPRLNPALKYKSNTPLSIAFLTIPVTCFGLGCWQYKRRQWKLDLLDKIAERAYKEPTDLPYSVEVLQSEDMEYAHVRLTGEFDHRRELMIAYRPNHHPERSPVGVKNRLGAYILTPFKVKNSDLTVLVNRGWVPVDYMEKGTRRRGNIEGEVTLTGLVARDEISTIFKSDQPSKKNPWVWSRKCRDKMADFIGCDPVIIDADLSTTVEGGPIGGQTNLQLRNKHLEYIITWWLFAATAGIIWYRRFFMGSKLGNEFLAVMKDTRIRKGKN